MQIHEIVMLALTFVSVCAAVIFGVVAITDRRKKDHNAGGENRGVMISDIGYIKSSVDDIKNEVRRNRDKQEETNKEYNERITRVEESAKQAHKRIDGLEQKGEGS